MFGRKNEDQDPDFSIYSVYDSISKSYDIPAFSLNNHVLVRDVVNMLKDPAQAKNKYNTNAEDYTIFKIGTFDKKTGEITPQNLERVAYMHELRSMTQPSDHLGALSPT